jgi:ubiquinone/menaquinone biosynthesis C-methylase UbiE
MGKWNTIGPWGFVSMGRFQWRGQTSCLKAAFFLLLGTPDTHTRLRNSNVINQIEQLELPPRSKVLEGGFGRAVTIFSLASRHPDWQFTGIELDPLMAGDARRAAKRGGYSNIQIIESSIEDVDSENAFDLAISIDIIEHIEDDVDFLKRHLRALKPDGLLVIHVPKRHQEQWRFIPAFRYHQVRSFNRRKESEEGVSQVHVHGHVRDEYTEDELRHILRKAGFEILSLRETIGRWGEISFELNQLCWRWPALRYLLATLTYPITILLGYLDILTSPETGNGLLVVAQPGSSQ